MSVIVRSSPLHGAGVYTTAPFKKGQRVLEYTGPRLTTRESEGMYAENEVTYLFSVNDETPGELAPCYCGAKTCRGTMFCDEEIARHKRILKRRGQRAKASPRRH